MWETKTKTKTKDTKSSLHSIIIPRRIEYSSTTVSTVCTTVVLSCCRAVATYLAWSGRRDAWRSIMTREAMGYDATLSLSLFLLTNI